MIILKVFNNNSVVALNENRQDVILTGSGVGFQRKVGDIVDEKKSDRIATILNYVIIFLVVVFIGLCGMIGYAVAVPRSSM